MKNFIGNVKKYTKKIKGKFLDRINHITSNKTKAIKSIKDLIDKYRPYKKHIIIGISIVAICIFSFSIYLSGFAYEVTFNGENIGVVKNIEDFNKSLTIVNNEISTWYKNKNVHFQQDVTFEKVRIKSKEEIKNVNEFTQTIFETGINIEIMGAVIEIDGEEVVCLASEEEANEVKDNVLKTYTGVSEKEKLLSSNMKQAFEVVKKEIDYSKLKGKEQAVTYILQGTDEILEYQVKPGDTTWDIALSRGMSISEVKAANPDKNLESLHKGDVLKLTVPKPYVTISVKKEVVYDKKISYGTTYVKDSSLYVGETKLKESGKYGTNEVTAEISYENGIEIKRDILSEKVIKEPKNQIIAKGSKPLPPVIGTGKFVIPASGRVTALNKPGSHAGGRAVDIANSIGTGIFASDTGVVKSVGWSGSYGKRIIIDHGGGYSTLYAHLSSYKVSVGQKVTKGQLIAKMGNTGRSTGPHVHFEIRYNNSRQVITKYFTYLRKGRYVTALK